MGLSKLLASFLGAHTGEAPRAPAPPARDLEAPETAFVCFSTFSLKDGHVLATEMEKLGLPFEVEFDDGIGRVNMQFGSAGHEASMTLYVQERDFDIVRDLVKLHLQLEA